MRNLAQPIPATHIQTLSDLKHHLKYTLGMPVNEDGDVWGGKQIPTEIKDGDLKYATLKIGRDYVDLGYDEDGITSIMVGENSPAEFHYALYRAVAHLQESADRVHEAWMALEDAHDDLLETEEACYQLARSGQGLSHAERRPLRLIHPQGAPFESPF